MEEPKVDYQKCQIQVALMKKDIENFEVIFVKLDTAIEKIGTVSGDITRMLAVHDEKIKSQERDSSDIHLQMEHHNMTTHGSLRDDLKDLHGRITTVNREVSANIIATENKIMDGQASMMRKVEKGQDEIKNFFIKSHTTLETRVTTLEKWRYVLVGIFIVVGMLATVLGNWISR